LLTGHDTLTATLVPDSVNASRKILCLDQKEKNCPFIRVIHVFHGKSTGNRSTVLADRRR